MGIFRRLDRLSFSVGWWGAQSRDATPTHWKEAADVVTSWGVLGMSYREEARGRPSHAADVRSRLALQHCSVPRDELAGERNVWGSCLGLRWAKETRRMDDLLYCHHLIFYITFIELGVINCSASFIMCSTMCYTFQPQFITKYKV